MSFSLSAEQKQSALWLAVAIAFIILLSYLGPILMPFVVAGILAYVLNPAVDRLCRCRAGRWTLPRSLAVSLVIIGVLMLMLTLFLIMLPILRTQIPQLQNQIPLFFDKLNLVLTPFLSDLGFHVKLDSAGIKAILTEHLAASSEDIGKAVLASIKVGGTAVLGMVANLVLIPVVLFYFLMEWAVLVRTLENAIPRRYLHKSQAAILEVDGILAQFLRGQIMLMLSLALYYSLALSLVKFNLALPVGIITGFLVFIPYLGYGLGLVLALIGAVLQFNDVAGVMWVGLIYAIGQVLESFILTPRLVGERIGLHPLAVIFALMAFGQIFGFIGILVALPVSAILTVAVKQMRSAYLNSSFYRHS